jgi:hypothetical protein
MAIVVEALSQGFYVSIADDGGMQAAFGSFWPLPYQKK